MWMSVTRGTIDVGRPAAAGGRTTEPGMKVPGMDGNDSFYF